MRERALAGAAGLGLSCIAAAGVIALLLHWAGGSLKDWFVPLLHLNWVFALLVLCSTGVNLALTALKWRYVVTRVAGGVPGFRYLEYTTLTALAGQVLPLHLVSIVVRPLAMRYHLGWSVQRGTATTVVDHAYDVLIPALIVFPALLLMSQGATLTIQFLGSVAGIAVVPILVVSLGHFDWKLYCLSALRFANLALRGVCAALALGLDIEFVVLVFATAALSLSQLLAVTPGGLGVSELGAGFVLVLWAVSPSVALQFAFGVRVLAFGSVLACAGVVFLRALGSGSIEAQQDSERAASGRPMNPNGEGGG